MAHFIPGGNIMRFTEGNWVGAVMSIYVNEYSLSKVKL